MRYTYKNSAYNNLYSCKIHLKWKKILPNKFIYKLINLRL